MAKQIAAVLTQIFEMTNRSHQKSISIDNRVSKKSNNIDLVVKFFGSVKTCLCDF